MPSLPDSLRSQLGDPGRAPSLSRRRAAACACVPCESSPGPGHRQRTPRRRARLASEVGAGRRPHHRGDNARVECSDRLARLSWYSYTIAMRFVDDPDAAAWLDALEGNLEDFDWDAGNQTKNRKHGVEDEDIEALLGHPVLLAGRIIQPRHDEPRWLLLGRDQRGRRLALIFTRRGDRLRPISCRPMRRTERQVYEEAADRAS